MKEILEDVRNLTLRQIEECKCKIFRYNHILKTKKLDYFLMDSLLKGIEFTSKALSKYEYELQEINKRIKDD